MNDDIQTMPVFDLVDQFRQKLKDTDMDPLTALVLSVLINRIETLGRSMAVIEQVAVMHDNPEMNEIRSIAKEALS